MNPYWKDRGSPWEYHPGPPENRRWAELFARTPNYRGLGKSNLGKEVFRWHFGPVFYRGRLEDHAVKVLVVGQDGAQDESLAHRSFTGGTGSRMQYFLNYIGITESYLFLNTFIYPIVGQYDDGMASLAQDPQAPIAKHRHDVFNYVLDLNDVHLIIAVGNAAKESIVTWVRSRGGTCSQGAANVSLCTSEALGPLTKIVGVMHPGAAGQGGSAAAILADFKKALAKIKSWMDADPAWLPPDAAGSRMFDQPYKYRSAPIPFRDYPYGVPIRLGRGGTSSNRKDGQRSIQIFSARGVYNAGGVKLKYIDPGGGNQEGYWEEPGDVPYEPPKTNFTEYDSGPGSPFARLMMGGETGLEWPDFTLLGATAHPSFGTGPIYRGRLGQAYVLILADQQDHDDLFSGRALTGESGQRMQVFLQNIGILKSYVIIRILPVDTLDLSEAGIASIVNHAQTKKVYQAIVDKIRTENPDLKLVLTFGPHAQTLSQSLSLGSLPVIRLKAWKEQGALQDWQGRLPAIGQIAYKKDTANPSLVYNGQKGQIPRFDLPYGTLRWQGSSGGRARRPVDLSTNRLSPDYYKLIVPDWVFQLKPLPL